MFYAAKIALVCDCELKPRRVFFLQDEYGLLKEEVEAMARLASRLSDVCPERMNAVGTEIQTSLNAWDELGKSVAENKKRLLQFGHLRQFFRNYLAMMQVNEKTIRWDLVLFHILFKIDVTRTCTSHNSPQNQMKGMIINMQFKLKISFFFWTIRLFGIIFFMIYIINNSHFWLLCNFY